MVGRLRRKLMCRVTLALDEWHLLVTPNAQHSNPQSALIFA